ncbi:MAG TPA: hypothetical protein VGK13_03535 [Methanocellaceae archaeon]|jgi:hypothetical protein
MKQGSTKPDSVKAFIRQTLGCDCDESVFEHIENDRGVEAGGVRLRNRINVGGRLLVYIVDAEGPGFVKSHVPGLLEAGRKDRDDHHFNRIRLVLVAADDSGVKLAAEHEFKRSKAVDEKVHLHVLDKSVVASL